MLRPDLLLLVFPILLLAAWKWNVDWWLAENDCDPNDEHDQCK